MPGPSRAVADTRRAVRAVLAELADAEPGALVLVACSGGADSLALAAATAFEAPRLALSAGAVVVEHGLQAGSATVALDAAHTLRAVGLAPVVVRPVTVPCTGDGPEADARAARYAALDAVADEHDASRVLLGHTMNDQAEQVLLGLARGSGARSLAGMPARRGRYLRPFLGLARETTQSACRDQQLTFWDDPQNADPAFTRVRARQALADLEDDLGPGVTAALARTAAQLREDAQVLEQLACEAHHALKVAAQRKGVGGIEVTGLHSQPRAIRTRVWRLLAIEAGSPPGQLTAAHVEAMDALLTRWHGQGPVHLPGAIAVTRAEGAVAFMGLNGARGPLAHG